MELTLRAAVLLAGKGGGSVAILKPVGDEVWVTLQRGAWRLRGGVLPWISPGCSEPAPLSFCRSPALL